MKRLRKMLDNIEPLFVKGGRFERFHAIYEMVDTLFYSPPDVTRGSPHIRDAIDLKRVMIMVVFAATPCALVGMWNTGYQANTAMLAMGLETLPGWRETILLLLGGSHDAGSIYDNFLIGALYFVPIYAVTMAAGGFWEMLFSGIRNHEINEGFFVTSFLYALILPARNDSALAGCDRHQLRCCYRQGSVWRNRQECSQPGARRPRFPVFRLPGADIRRCGVDRR